MNTKPPLKKRLMNAIEAFMYSWRTGESLKETRLASLAEAIDAFSKNNDIIKRLEDVANKADGAIAHAINEWLNEKILSIFPAEIGALYIQDKVKVPGLDLKVNRISDITTRTYSNDVTLHLRGKLIGHVIITAHPSSDANSGLIEIKEIKV